MKSTCVWCVLRVWSRVRVLPNASASKFKKYFFYRFSFFVFCFLFYCFTVFLTAGFSSFLVSPLARPLSLTGILLRTMDCAWPTHVPTPFTKVINRTQRHVNYRYFELRGLVGGTLLVGGNYHSLSLSLHHSHTIKQTHTHTDCARDTSKKRVGGKHTLLTLSRHRTHTHARTSYARLHEGHEQKKSFRGVRTRACCACTRTHKVNQHCCGGFACCICACFA